MEKKLVTRKPMAKRADAAATAVGQAAAEKDCEQHREDLLDEALAQSFPAGDPPSIARPPAKGC